MSFKTIIQRLLPLDDLKATALRFPLSVLCALILFVIGMMIIHDVIDDNNRDVMRLCTWLGCLYFWFGIVKLFSETLRWGVAKHVLCAAVGAVFLWAIVFIPQLWGLHVAFILPALLLLIMAAPYLQGGDDISFWFFNRQMWMGVFVSYIALFMFAGGLSLALLAVQELFDLRLSDKIWAQIWLFSCVVLAPVYALSWVPKGFVFDKEDCKDPPGLKFLANWISAPMVFVYLLILYAYFIRILVLGEVPNGILAYMITGFIGAGVVTYLISWPLREEGSAQLKLLHKIFFPALIIPTGFHFYAIYERVSAYGFTEQRYYIFLSALWFAFLAIGFTWRRLPIKWIPLSLAGLLVFGALSGVTLSSHSQMARFEHFMHKNNLLVDGKIVKAEKDSDIPYEDRRELSSILDYLCSTGRDHMIAHIFTFKDYSGKSADKCHGGYSLTEQIGFKHVSHYEQRSDNEFIRINHYNYTANRLDVRGYDYFQRQQYLNRNTCSTKPCAVPVPADGFEISVQLQDDTRIEFYRDGVVILEHDLASFIEANKEREDNNAPLFLELENDVIKIRINFSQISGEYKDEKPVLNNMSFDFLYRLKDKK